MIHYMYRLHVGFSGNMADISHNYCPRYHADSCHTHLHSDLLNSHRLVHQNDNWLNDHYSCILKQNRYVLIIVDDVLICFDQGLLWHEVVKVCFSQNLASFCLRRSKLGFMSHSKVLFVASLISHCSCSYVSCENGAKCK